MKKILVICQYYYPENFQITPICEQLVKDGYDVTVLTGLPNYPTGIIPDEYKKKERWKENINGVNIIRVSLIGRKKGPVFLALNYFSFLFNATKKVKKIGNGFDLVFVYQLSPVLMAIPGIKYTRKHKVPLVLYCLDLWPESLKMYVKDESNFIFRYVKKISTKIYKACSSIVIQSTSFRRYFTEVHSIENTKIDYIPAFADENYLAIKEKEISDNVDFIFLGNLGIAQNLLQILESINLIKDIPNFKIHFVGDGTVLSQMKEYVINNHLEEKVVFYGRRPVEEMINYYNIADACIVSLKADNQTGLTLPAKVQGYMAAGKTILGMIDGSAMEVINEAKCGVCVHSDDVQGFADLMKDFIVNRTKYENYGKNGRDYFINNFRKEVFMNKLEEKFDKLCTGE